MVLRGLLIFLFGVVKYYVLLRGVNFNYQVVFVLLFISVYYVT